MARFWLTLSRMCLAAWVGIASFFVVVLISLRGSPLFSDDAKLAHPKVLFPLFYAFEFWLLGIAFAAGLLATRYLVDRCRRRRIAMALMAVALLAATIDYFVVYRPLAAMIEMPVRPAEFAAYHEWSRWLNLASLVVCAVAAMLVLWPSGEGRRMGES